jgi:hypothetical protein
MRCDLTRLNDFQDPPPAITTAEQAIARARGFLIEYGYRISRPVYAQQDGEQWIVKFDVSILGPRQTIRLTIDSQSGAIMAFSDEGTE